MYLGLFYFFPKNSFFKNFSKITMNLIVRFFYIYAYFTFYLVLYFCPSRDFAQKAKFRGGTLVTRVYIKESTYSWNIQSVCQKKISIFLNRGREESVGNDDVSIVCARKYEMVRMT